MQRPFRGPLRRRLRLSAVALAAACALSTAACSGGGRPAQAAGSASGSSSASSSGGSGAGSYLALGDSVPFGFRGKPAGIDYSKPTDFTGYPELVGKKLGLDVINSSCPGETTASFSDVKAQSNGCENTLQTPAGYRTTFPLHVPYASPTQSQLDFALSTLQSTKVSLVTLQLGANDAFLCQQTTADKCLTEGGSVVQTAATNIGNILAALHDRGGYRGKVVVVTYYALDYAGTAAGPTQLLDSVIASAAQAHGATVVSGFDAFRPVAQKSGGDSVTAGLVIAGDVHPTATGQQLLADAVEKAVTG